MSNPNMTRDLSADLVKLYRANAHVLADNTGEILNMQRQDALEDFMRLGVPDIKNEDYKYTRIEDYLKGNYDVEFTNDPFKVNLREIFKCDIPELDTHVVLVMNGFYYHDNNLSDLPEGIIVCGLNEASVRYPEIFRQHYGRYARTANDGLIALNTLFAHDGVFVYVPEGQRLDRPLQVINLSFSFRNLRITRRNLIITGDNATCNIILCDHTLSAHSYVTNSLTEVYAGKNARFDFSRMQNENSISSQITHTFIHQEENSVVSSNTISLHGGLIRNNFYSRLNGTGCENNVYGLFLGDDNQHIANYTLINHATPNSTSNQLFKGILDDNATGAFNGKIYVSRNAQKTIAYQKNNNLLLSPTARMNSKPHLEIYADDVKCSHGATIGRLDNEAMFYLRSRGISEKEARQLLMYAFADEIIGKIQVSLLRDRIIDMVDKRLRGELACCSNCDLRFG
ncbi:MAG: Fe-S cluster assembly protein SufD [Bacteroidales bacterium]|nr:Fe-S cluster assembly protein SufD [Bacteroidales bacterium]MBN2764636.1 Fe-S cluster assembly protein SufD [Bacteroidales bacterium]